jgi:hypothetical protein
MALSKRVWRSAYISIAIIISAAGLAQATTVIMPTDTQLMIESRAIIRAKVRSVSTAADEQSGIVYTYIKLKVTDVFKGEIRDRLIVVKQPGGSIGDRGTMVFSAPRFSVGEQVIVYLQTMQDGTLRVHDAFLGKYSIVKDAATSKLIVVRGAPQDQVTILPQTSPGDSTDEMELGAYLRKLRAGLSANMQRSLEFADQYYARTPMLSEPPEYQGKARSGALQPAFHLLGPGRWTQADRGQSVTYLINSTGAPSGFQADVDAAMTAWSTVAGCSLRIVDGGTTSSGPGASGTAVADFTNSLGFFSSAAGACQNILAEGGFQWDGNTSVVNGTTFHEISYGYIEFNPWAACSFTSACNVEEVTTHEMGHTLGMGHSWDTSYQSTEGNPTPLEQAATMYYIAHFDGRCASIMTDDVNGIKFIYPGSTTSSTGSTPGLYSASTSTFFLRYSNAAGPADLTFQYGPGNSGWIPLTGDWTGSGIATAGFYDPATGVWFLKNSNSAGAADMVFQYGPANSGWMPVVGDWDGNGTQTVGLYNPATSVFFLKNTNAAGAADVVFQYGPANSGWIPLAGKWTGAAADTVGLYSPANSVFFLKNTNSAGAADSVFQYGPANSGWTPVVGNWSGSGADTVGFFAPSNAAWFLRNSNTGGPADNVFAYGFANGTPLAGKWH